LTPPVELRPGMSYAWSVEVEAGPRKGTRAFAAFSVADEGTRAHWMSLAPDAAAPVSQWVLYAGALWNAGFQVEAAAAWKTVEQQRPGMRFAPAR
jgi:hypothetical protein